MRGSDMRTGECPHPNHRRNHDRVRQLLVRGGVLADQDGH